MSNEGLHPMTTALIVLIVAFLGALLVPILSQEKGRRSLLLALRSLWLHKLRAFLSVLGIIIGTAAVIALMGFGEGSMQDALEDIKRMGATNIIVRSVKPPEEANTQRRSWVANYGITPLDYDRFATIGTVRRMVPMRIFPQEVRYLDLMHTARVVGTVPDYAEVNKLKMAAGRFLTEQDDYQIDNVCVLGAETAQVLFPFEDPMGLSVRINKHQYVVVGIVADRMPTGGSGGSQAAEDYNSDVYIPFQTCRARFGEVVTMRAAGARSAEKVAYSQVTLTVGHIDEVRPTGEVVNDLMERHLKKDWAVTVPLDRLEEAERAKNRYTILLVFIASISLVVGGIGIMNIMLATVTERTREIGIRRALGAKRRDITLQFLVEAVVQTTVGGLAGVTLGLGIVLVVPWLLGLWGVKLPATVNTLSIFLSVAVAVGVGVLFGWYPARRASRLDPIEALRHV